MLACKNGEKSNWETFISLDVSVNILLLVFVKCVVSPSVWKLERYWLSG
jgi:hypothetical protein